jgi:antitoxin (DNA-binding transcriptional repressor) of toxin-antitoxin stability system
VAIRRELAGRRYRVRQHNRPSKRTTIAIREFTAAIDLVRFMIHNIVVNRVNIHDAKTNLSRYLAELTPGKTLVLCNRNRPVAELRSLRKPGVRAPRIGAARGEFVVPDSFFEPLPDEIIKAFSGE